MNPHEQAVALFVATGANLKILPGNEVPANAQWHICTVAPCSPTNKSGICTECGCPVYFSDHRPKLKKICINCVLKFAKTNKIEAYGNTEAIVKAVLHGKQN